MKRKLKKGDVRPDAGDASLLSEEDTSGCKEKVHLVGNDKGVDDAVIPQDSQEASADLKLEENEHNISNDTEKNVNVDKNNDGSMRSDEDKSKKDEGKGGLEERLQKVVRRLSRMSKSNFSLFISTFCHFQHLSNSIFFYIIHTSIYFISATSSETPVLKRLSTKTNPSTSAVKCSNNNCSLYFHLSCFKATKHTRVKGSQITCPAHMCHSCASDSDKCHLATKGMFILS